MGPGDVHPPPLGRDHEARTKGSPSCPMTPKTTIGNRAQGKRMVMQKSIRQLLRRSASEKPTQQSGRSRNCRILLPKAGDAPIVAIKRCGLIARKRTFVQVGRGHRAREEAAGRPPLHSRRGAVSAMLNEAPCVPVRHGWLRFVPEARELQRCYLLACAIACVW